MTKAADVLKETGGSLLVIADSIDTPPEPLSSAAAVAGLRIQVLAMTSPESPVDPGMEQAVDGMKATLQRMTVDNRDIDNIVKRAASAPALQAGNLEARWQEAGYVLVPLIALLVLAPFRREQRTEPFNRRTPLP